MKWSVCCSDVCFVTDDGDDSSDLAVFGGKGINSYILSLSLLMICQNYKLGKIQKQTAPQ